MEHNNILENTQKFQDLEEFLADSVLSEEEKDELLEKYYGEHLGITTDTSQALTGLQDELSVEQLEYDAQIFHELQNIGTEELIQLQILSGTTVDGIIGPKTFSSILELGNRFPSLNQKNISQILGEFRVIYESSKVYFDSLTHDERTTLQTSIGTQADGIFGPKTFQALMGKYDEIEGDFFTNIIEPSSSETEVILDVSKEVTQEAELIDIPVLEGVEEVNIEPRNSTPLRDSELSWGNTFSAEEAGEEDYVSAFSDSNISLGFGSDIDSLGEVGTLRDNDNYSLSIDTILSENNIQQAISWTQSNLHIDLMRAIGDAIGFYGTSHEDLVRAVAQYQSNNGLQIDGKAGKSTLDSLGINASDYQSVMTDTQIASANTSIEVGNTLETVEQLSERWRTIYSEFFLHLTTSEQQEVLDGKPFTLVDYRTKQLIFIGGGEYMEMDVILGQNGATTGGYVENDRRTPVGQVHRFDTVRFGEERSRSILAPGQPYFPELMPTDNNSWTNLRYNPEVQSYYGTRNGEPGKRVTVVGIALQSEFSQSFGGRYFHLVGPDRNATWGCVGIEYDYREQAVAMARIIQEEGGFGYVSNTR